MSPAWPRSDSEWLTPPAAGPALRNPLGAGRATGNAAGPDGDAISLSAFCTYVAVTVSVPRCLTPGGGVSGGTPGTPTANRLPASRRPTRQKE